MNNRAFELRKQGQETLNRLLKPFKLSLGPDRATEAWSCGLRPARQVRLRIDDSRNGYFSRIEADGSYELREPWSFNGSFFLG